MGYRDCLSHPRCERQSGSYFSADSNTAARFSRRIHRLSQQDHPRRTIRSPNSDPRSPNISRRTATASLRSGFSATSTTIVAGCFPTDRSGLQGGCAHHSGVPRHLPPGARNRTRTNPVRHRRRSRRVPEDSLGNVGVIDETSRCKKGNETPGVQRQYLGCVGKLDNGIVSVHLEVSGGDSTRCSMPSCSCPKAGATTGKVVGTREFPTRRPTARSDESLWNNWPNAALRDHPHTRCTHRFRPSARRQAPSRFRTKAFGQLASSVKSTGPINAKRPDS